MKLIVLWAIDKTNLEFHFWNISSMVESQNGVKQGVKSVFVLTCGGGMCCIGNIRETWVIRCGTIPFVMFLCERNTMLIYLWTDSI